VILIDSDILINIIDRDPLWFEWSFANLEQAAAGADLIVNAIVVGEVAPRFGSLSDFMDAMASLPVRVEPLPIEAAFLAGEAFQRYLQNRTANQPKSILADFLIGGHAQLLGAAILTRDARRYIRYFDMVPLITPTRESHD